MIADADNFVTTFPKQVVDAKQRALLMISALMLDYFMFEDRNRKQGGQH